VAAVSATAAATTIFENIRFAIIQTLLTLRKLLDRNRTRYCSFSC
jgi:hypothetical protein